MSGALSPEFVAMIEKTLNTLGYDLVRVRVTAGRGRSTLQIMAEPVVDSATGHYRGMTVDDCEKISRSISPLLEVEDPIKAAYVLEVSSPGIDRPLMKWVDYQRFAGFEAKIELKMPQDGRKRFQGRIKSDTANGTVILTIEAVEVSFDFNDINNGQLVLTDDLLEAAAQQQVDEQE